MTDLIAKMEAFRSRLNPMKPYEEEHYITLTEAISALRERGATIRQCAEVCRDIALQGEKAFAKIKGDPTKSGIDYQGAVARACESAILKLLEGDKT